MLLADGSIRKILEKEGRVILPIAKRVKHEEVLIDEESKLADLNAAYCKRFANYSVDIYKEVKDKNTGGKRTVLEKRRFFDKDGYAEQDVDFSHRDQFKNHLFPHIHVWIKDEEKAKKRIRIDKNVCCREEKMDILEEQLKWLRKNAITDEEFNRVMNEGPRVACSYPRGLLIWLSAGREFNVEYKGVGAFISLHGLYGGLVSVETKSDVQVFDDMESFIENATINGEYIKEVCSKWTVTASA